MTENDATFRAESIRRQLAGIRSGRARQLRGLFVALFGYSLLLAAFLAVGNHFWSTPDGARWPLWFSALIPLSLGAGAFLLVHRVKKESADKGSLDEALASTPTRELILIANEAPTDGRYAVIDEFIVRTKMKDELARAFLFRQDLNDKVGIESRPRVPGEDPTETRTQTMVPLLITITLVVIVLPLMSFALDSATISGRLSRDSAPLASRVLLIGTFAVLYGALGWTYFRLTPRNALAKLRQASPEEALEMLLDDDFRIAYEARKKIGFRAGKGDADYSALARRLGILTNAELELKFREILRP